MSREKPKRTTQENRKGQRRKLTEVRMHFGIKLLQWPLMKYRLGA